MKFKHFINKDTEHECTQVRRQLSRRVAPLCWSRNPWLRLPNIRHRHNVLQAPRWFLSQDKESFQQATSCRANWIQQGFDSILTLGQHPFFPVSIWQIWRSMHICIDMQYVYSLRCHCGLSLHQGGTLSLNCFVHDLRMSHKKADRDSPSPLSRVRILRTIEYIELMA